MFHSHMVRIHKLPIIIDPHYISPEYLYLNSLESVSIITICILQGETKSYLLLSINYLLHCLGGTM